MLDRDRPLASGSHPRSPSVVSQSKPEFEFDSAFGSKRRHPRGAKRS